MKRGIQPKGFPRPGGIGAVRHDAQPAIQPKGSTLPGRIGAHRRQQQQITRPGVVSDKELRTTPYYVEDRLRDGQAPESHDVERFESGITGVFAWQRFRNGMSFAPGTR